MQLITFENCAGGYGITYGLENNAIMSKTPVMIAKEITGLTGEALAEKLGISAPHLSRLNTGKSPTTTTQIRKLAEICNVSEQEFYRLMSGFEQVSSDTSQKIAATEPDELLSYDPAIFEIVIEETRKIDHKYAGGHADTVEFNALMHAIYKFIKAVQDD